jgi:DNA polymerase-1
MDGFEADDIIGAISEKAENEGLVPLIITGDRDELQLATDVTNVVITKKGITDFELYDRGAMIEKYGLTPDQFIDYKGLMGDQSDNIPGIPGVGEKTAQKLLIEFGSIENLIDSTDKIQNENLRKKIEDNTQLALMSKRLATINKNVPIPIDFEEFRVIGPDYNQLIDVYVKLEFNSFLKKMDTVGTTEKKQKKFEFTAVDKAVNKIVVKSLNDISALSESMDSASYITLKVFNDCNHRNVPEIFGIGIAAGENCFYINGDNKELIEGFLNLLSEKRTPIAGHSLIGDYYALFANGFKGRLFTAFDTEVAQ